VRVSMESPGAAPAGPVDGQGQPASLPARRSGARGATHVDLQRAAELLPLPGALRLPERVHGGALADADGRARRHEGDRLVGGGPAVRGGTTRVGSGQGIARSGLGGRCIRRLRGSARQLEQWRQPNGRQPSLRPPPAHDGVRRHRRAAQGTTRAQRGRGCRGRPLHTRVSGSLFAAAEHLAPRRDQVKHGAVRAQLRRERKILPRSSPTAATACAADPHMTHCSLASRTRRRNSDAATSGMPRLTLATLEQCPRRLGRRCSLDRPPPPAPP
jgi:hypothetical protein